MITLINSSNLNANLGNASISSIRVCKVVSVVLDDTHPMFKDLGGWPSVGTIFFAYLDTATDAINNNIKSKDNIAFPLDPNNKRYPLQNEVVYTISLPTIPNENNQADSVLYYFSSINLLNSPHHNAYIIQSKQAVRFNQVGMPYRDAKVTSPAVTFGAKFTENVSVRPLLSVVGDYIIEGRHGNSLRFGGSLSDKITQWKSEKQANYFIISGRSQIHNENIPVIEDINTDDYFIAGFSDHIVNFDLPCTIFDSYNVNITNENISHEQLYEIEDTNVSNTTNDVKDPIIFDSNEPVSPVNNPATTTEPEPEELYTEGEGEFVTPDYVYVLPEETVIEREAVYNEIGDVTIESINIIPMNYVTLNQLTQIVGHPTVAKQYLKVVNQTLTLYRINNNKRIAHFLSQCLIESLYLTRFEEIGSREYFKKYDNRAQLGNNTPGDGYKFRGRGAIQITGKWNYTALNNDLKYGANIILTNPDTVSKYPLNILSAGWYWNKRSLNTLADADNIGLIRKKVQGTSYDRITDIQREYNKIIKILSSGTA